MIIRYHQKNVSHVPPLSEDMCYYIDVTVLLKGSMYYMINGEPVVLHSGDAIVYQIGDIRSRKESREAEYRSFNVLLGQTEQLPRLHGVIRDCMTEEMHSILDLASRLLSDESTTTDEMAEHIFYLLYYDLYNKSKAVKEPDTVVKIKEYVGTHLSEPLSLSQISTQVFLSPNYCNYLFKNCTGETITSYVIRMKMERAKNDLLNTDKPLTEISASLGYAYYSYFSKLFKKKMKISPTELRQTHIFLMEKGKHFV